jgi:adenine-specific DNA methylase
MGSVLYAVVLKTPQGMEFRPAEPTDFDALEAAEQELARLRPKWEREGIIPTEERYKGDCDRSVVYGLTTWASLFAPRQLLALGVLVEELRRLRPEIIAKEGEAVGEAVAHLLAFVISKFTNYNSRLSFWHSIRGTMANTFDRHDFSFKATFAEMATCVAGSGLEWAIDNVLDAYEALAKLPRSEDAKPVVITQGSATNLVEVDDKSVAAVVVDPPYADNVQYAELADFFYVWLKRTQGHRRPEWFSSPLCDPSEEAVVNVSRFRESPKVPAKDAKARAYERYDQLMTDTFREAHRVLRDDGVLTVMFTHKKQEAWASLFEALIRAGFTITAAFPVRTESAHSLHQAGKNAAQSTVILASRKRPDDAGRGYFDDAMREEIRQTARVAAETLAEQGLTGIDGLVGSFGKAMAVFSRYAEVRTDTGQRVGVTKAIQAAADAVAEWRAEQLAERGLEGLDAASRFVLLCWDVMNAPEFRFNEAMLLGRSVGMDVETLIASGLLAKKSEQVRLLPATERRRERSVRRDSPEAQLMLIDLPKRGRERRVRAVHPLDEVFASAIDACHAIALRYSDAGGGDAGIGAVRGMARQQGWSRESPCARLMEALVKAAPASVRFPVKAPRQKVAVADVFPEFRTWHALLEPVFGIPSPEWKRPVNVAPQLPGMSDDDEGDETDGDEE